MAKSKEQRKARKDAKRQSKVDTPEAGEPLVTPEPDLKAIAKRALEVQTEFERAREAGTLEGGQGDKAMVRPTSAPHKDYQDMPGGFGYRMYDDGSIEIIQAPAQYTHLISTFPKEGGKAFLAIKAQVEGKPTAPKPEAKVAPEVETAPAPAPALEAPVAVDSGLEAQAKAQEKELERQLAREQDPEGYSFKSSLSEPKAPEAPEAPGLVGGIARDTAKAALDFPSRLGQAGVGIADVLGALTSAAAKKAYGAAYGTEPGKE